MSTLTEIYGEPIHTYTAEQAVADGALIRLDPALCEEGGYLLPVLLTPAAHLDLVRWERPDDPWQDETGRAWDVLTMVRQAAKASLQDGDRHQFRLLRIPNRTRSNALSRAHTPAMVSAWAVVQSFDGAGARPCLTIMLEGED